MFVIAETGLFHAYSLDLERGGECVLIKEFSCVSLTHSLSLRTDRLLTAARPLREIARSLITNDDPAVSEI